MSAAWMIYLIIYLFSDEFDFFLGKKATNFVPIECKYQASARFAY